MTSSAPLEFSDIQGLIVRGYGTLPAACYLLLSVSNHQKALPWLRELTTQLTYADLKPQRQAINLAVTHSGLNKLHIGPEILDGFSDEFRSGMSTTHKRHILGDEGDDAPEHWLWGGPATPSVDLLLLCYAKDQNSLDNLLTSLLGGLTKHGVELIAQLDTEMLVDNKEHFGFRDAIGQPYLAQFDKSGQGQRANPVALGEFLLGYPNGYERYTQRPLVPASDDPDHLLANDPEGSGQRDLGFNGSYLVFRQLFQDVPAFWRFMQQQSKQLTRGPSDPIQLAAKMVGRWPSGAALVQAPNKDDPEILDKDDFSYHAVDPDGLKCPLGAHIRRTHPRDSLNPEPGSEKSVAFSNRHRLLRRGRPYGKPLDASMDPARFLQLLEHEPAPAARGLHFICLNANIGRQFEFVQHTWANNPNFNGLYRDTDPIIGPRFHNGLAQNQFTIQQCPARVQVKGLPAFVRMRGGAYFFLPSRRAMTYLFS